MLSKQMAMERANETEDSHRKTKNVFSYNLGAKDPYNNVQPLSLKELVAESFVLMVADKHGEFPTQNALLTALPPGRL